MGELPDWYVTLRAAKVLNVPPWELASQPAIWQEWALSAEAAESAAQSERQRHAERKKPKHK